MNIPRVWTRISVDQRRPDGKTVQVAVWGWGNDEWSAKTNGSDRLQRMLERLRRGDPFPEKYAYGTRPLREEILRTFKGERSDEPSAVLTRNSYGAQVLNSARLLFLDIDFPPPGIIGRIQGIFGAPSAEEKSLASLRAALRHYGGATFRIYRTAAGLRVIAIDREFEPAGREAQDLMKATSTDPAFANLCVVQRSFRARLTPKPWRCNIFSQPPQYPRQDNEAQRRFDSWLNEYERTSDRYAICRYIETIGSGNPVAGAGELLDLHDRVTRCNEPLPLA